MSASPPPNSVSTSIENITGSAFGDELEGDGAINVLSGGKGATSDSGDFFGPNDVITDFTRAQGDKIDLHFIDAKASVGGNQDFTFISGGPFTAEGQVRAIFLLADPAKTIVALNTDSDPFAEMEIELNFVSVSAADFVL